jgi:hypothetical protein
MLTLIAAALAAAQPGVQSAATPPPADHHAQHRQMGQADSSKPATMKMDCGMKDCCRDGMAAKMKGEHANHQGDQHHNHNQ